MQIRLWKAGVARSLAVVLLAFAPPTVSCVASDDRPPSLSPEQCEAIRAAELFVTENGYTSDPPSPDPGRFRPERPEEARVPRSSVLQVRHGTLKSGAVGLSPGQGGVDDVVGWSVFFEYLASPEDPKKDGVRAVFVPAGNVPSEVFMFRIDLRRDKMKIRLGPRTATSKSCGWRTK